nr:HU family DNA-binding protein [Parabacteroides goldsteinii]
MNSRLTIQDLAALLAERTGKDRSSAELFLREFIAIVSKGVFTDKIAKVKGLGSFKVVLVEKRESIHVNTGERFLIPAHYKFSFLPDKELRELVNKPFSFFETTELNENVDFTDLDVSAEIEEKEAEDESVEDIIPENTSPVEEPEVLPTPENTDEKEEEIVESSEVPESSEEEIIPEEIKSEEIQSEDTSDAEPEPPFESEPSPSGIVEPTAETPVEEPTPTPLANDFSDTDYQFEDEEPSTSPWIKWVVAAGIVGIIVAGSTLLYLNRSFFLGPEIPTKALTGRSLPDQAVASVDTLQEPELNTEIEEDNDTITVELPAITPETPAETPEVLATVKIETGSRLTLISLEYYGSKIFWVYLYDYNKAVIKDPNNIPVGTEIQVPAPRLYGIDKHSRASIDKAAARQTEILAGNL